MTTKHQTLILTMALAMSGLALFTIGCGSDPNGNTATGGTGAGGSTGGGGAGGAPTMLGAIVGMPVQTFDTNTSGFIFSAYIPPAGGEVNIGGTSMLTWDATEGSPTAGSLKVVAPFSDWNQWVEVQAATQAPLLNWTGKKLHVRMKVASGFGSDMFALGGAQPLVNTTSTYVQVNAPTTVALGTQWQEFIVDASPAIPPSGYDATMVITYGLHIYSGSGNTMAAKPTMATFYVDSFSLE